MCKLLWIKGLLKEFSILETISKKGYPKIILSITTIFANNQGVVKQTENHK